MASGGLDARPGSSHLDLTELGVEKFKHDQAKRAETMECVGVAEESRGIPQVSSHRGHRKAERETC